ncbi:alpha/beta hydrolase [Pleurocapsa sp. FMAR1]|uniref:alpha/beta hydrolase n=1 Tax=Pleurocapsa sp. FMAR1 TaxID=3040204 RepID=UPI0029C714BD|nr:alpha/beta hydrolase [Pleurocapsa sp. FMAR1]
MNFAQSTRFAIASFILGIFATVFPVTAIAAEKITFNLSPFGQFNIQVDDLETFVDTGEVSSELAYYLNRLPPQQVEKLPKLLSTPLEVNPLSISNFSNSTVGEAVIKNFGKGIRADANINGFFALRGAIIAAAFDDRGLTIINLLRQFPLETVYVDPKVIEQYIKRGSTLLKNRKVLDRAFLNHAQNSASSKAQSELQELQIQGTYTWNKRTLSYKNPRRDSKGYFDLYQPKVNQLVPLIVISHGLASDRQTFAYLGEHFASHGFAVAIVEHDDISLNKFDRFLSGSTRFPEPNNLIDQPLDVKSVLDRLEQESATNPRLQNKLNLQEVGVLGQSIGGYTSLALAGGKLTADKMAEECQPENYRDVLLDLSSLAKCTFDDLKDSHYQLQDPRIKAVVAINPLGKIFGKEGMGAIKIPTMLISGTHDLITPSVDEQLKPFTWLNRDVDKYLVLVKPGTHFSFLQEGLGVLPVPEGIVGPSPSSAYPGLKALSTAFFKAYLAHQEKYKNYLQSDRLDILSNDAFEFSLIRSLTPTKLQEIITNN